MHPKYQEVLFVDSTTDHKFVCGSTLDPKERGTFQGKEYPLYRLSTSSSSHPFFTGSKQLVDAEGRVDKFKKRYTAKAKDEPSKDGSKDESKKEEPKKAKAASKKK